MQINKHTWIIIPDSIVWNFVLLIELVYLPTKYLLIKSHKSYTLQSSQTQL